MLDADMTFENEKHEKRQIREAHERAIEAAEEAKRKSAEEVLTAAANKIADIANKIETRNEEASIAAQAARRKAALTAATNKIETAAETRNSEASIAAQEAINEADAAAAVETIEASRMIAATNTIEAEEESVTNAQVDAIIAAAKQEEAKARMQVPAARKPPDEPAAEEDEGSLVQLPVTARQLAEDQTSKTGLRGYLMHVHKNTDLHIAARDGNVELAQQLLAAGSDANAKNKVNVSRGGLDHDHVSAAGQVHPTAQSS